jgi:m7GpppX diphosphatase
LSEKSELNKT